MTTYICKCGRRVKKSTDADNTGNRLEGYGPSHECYGCPYVMSWGNYEWNEDTRKITMNVKGYECRMSPTLSYNSEFIGSTKDKCTCSVVSLDFNFLDEISAWVKETFTQGELTGGFSRDEIRATDYCHNGRYTYTLCCAQNKKGIAAKAALFAQFFNPDGIRKDITPQQEMEKILADIKKAKDIFSCVTAPDAETPPSPAPQDKAVTTVHAADVAALCGNAPAAPGFDFSLLGELSAQAAEADQQFDLHYGTAQDEYLISCIYLARIHSLTAKAGRYGGGTWTKWYESKGMSEGSARTMVKNGEAFNSATVAELKQLPNLTRKDLNLIARSGCADQLVQAAGNDQRVQELLDQLKAKDDALAAEKSRADTAEHHLDAARADVQGLTEQNHQLQQRADAAEAREEEAWSQREKAEQHAKDAEAALKHQPIATVVDKEEVRRQAEELSRQAKENAHKAVQEAQAQTAEAQAQLRQFQQAADGYLAPEQVCAQQAQLIADSMRTMYLGWFGKAAATGCPLAQMATPLYALCGEIMSSLEDDTSIDPTAAGSVEDAEREALFE